MSLISAAPTVRTDQPAVRPDPELWPGLAQIPSGPRAKVAAAVTAKLLRTVCRRLEIQLVAEPDRGDAVMLPGIPTIVIHDEDEFLRRVGADGLIGFGEAYLTGAWDSPDIALVIGVLATSVDRLVPKWMQRLRRVHVRREPRRHRNTVTQSRSNISHHYDLSNDLFALFLDPTLSYSSALFDTDQRSTGDHLVAMAPQPATKARATATLVEAQHRKIDRLLDQAGVGAGTRLLEIGTGWGELALRAAARGAVVRTVTLSQEQLELAQDRVAAAGLADRVTIELLDYRLVEGEYDAVISVEMVEAVGDEYWSTYFRSVEELLVPGGRFALQAITMPHQQMLDTRDDFTWIKKYIFPGGLLPSVEAIEEITRSQTQLRLTDRLSMGLHYAETLRLWDQAFTAAHHEVRALGFDPTFVRMWHFYLAYCQGGFAGGYTDVQQMTFVKDVT